ncbi:MAG: VOC family protein, partial [Candidatus Binatia bacterium]|nr:VOC family protein [Candidatus Binatia bacterium]
MSYKVNHFHIKAPDPYRTAQWYVDNVGAKIVSKRKSPGGEPLLRLDLHGVPLNITGYLEEQKLEQHYGLEHVAIDTDDF